MVERGPLRKRKHPIRNKKAKLHKTGPEGKEYPKTKRGEVIEEAKAESRKKTEV